MSRKPQNKLREAIPIPPPAPLPEPENIDFGSIFNEYASGAIDLIVVLGPTASGKTRYAVDLAHKCGNGEILSADSRQVYRGMDIGTGKDLNEYGDVPYHLIDIVPPGRDSTSTNGSRLLNMPTKTYVTGARPRFCAAAPGFTSRPRLVDTPCLRFRRMKS